MAKSTRSKVKRAFRAKKRQDGVYAVAEAARLQRLNLKLKAVATAEREQLEDGEERENEDEMLVEGEKNGTDGQEPSVPGDGADTMDLDSGAAPSTSTTTTTTTTKISTHGPRNSRREQWRASKGLTPRAKSKGMNRQGTIAARRKSGRSHRRR